MGNNTHGVKLTNPRVQQELVAGVTAQEWIFLLSCTNLEGIPKCSQEQMVVLNLKRNRQRISKINEKVVAESSSGPNKTEEK